MGSVITPDQQAGLAKTAEEGSFADYRAQRRQMRAGPTIAGVPIAELNPVNGQGASEDAGTAGDPNANPDPNANGQAADAKAGEGGEAPEAGGEGGDGTSAKPGGDSNQDAGGEAGGTEAGGDQPPDNEAEGDGTSAKPGEGQDNAWLTRRLNRQKRQLTKAHAAELETMNAENERLRAENARLRQASEQPPSRTDSRQAPAEALGDYYPKRSDYTNGPAYNAAVDVWEQGGDAQDYLEGMTDAAKARFESKAEPAPSQPSTAEQTEEQRYQDWFQSLSPQDQQKEAERQRKAEARAREARALLDDTYEILEESSVDLSEQFREGLHEDGAAQIQVTKAMLDFLADSDDTPVIVKAFVDKPRLSRAIARKKTVAEQVKALERLAGQHNNAGGKTPPKSSAAPTVPDLDDAVTQGNPNQGQKKPEDMTQAEYNAWRRTQVAQSRPRLVA